MSTGHSLQIEIIEIFRLFFSENLDAPIFQ